MPKIQSNPMKQAVNGSRARIGFVLGMLLLVGAGVYLLTDPEQIKEFANNIRHAPVWTGIVILVGPIANWVFVGLCLHALVRRHGVVGRKEMLALVGSAWLLNHLPMRPGLVGRIGYHAKVNSIRVRDSIEASVWSMVHAAIANAVAIGLMMLMPADMPISKLVGVLLIPIGVFALIAALGALKSVKFGYLMLGLVYRNLDLLVWMLRYAAAFAMIGIAITPVQIALITAASQIAQVIPLTGAGLGFREWGVGIAAKMSSTGTAITMRTAIGADVINRIAETIIVIPLGIVCTGIVARRYAAWAQANGEDELAEDQARDHAQDQDEPGQSSEQEPADH
ncbi:MAG: hypothetical protein JKX70_02175 [Phycisphaerales bacterium]|nr:hypothetical protein [Phycisphaerales bacterium]